MTNDIFENKSQRPDIARQRAMRGRYDVLLDTKSPTQQTSDKRESCAQVAPLVEQKIVQQVGCGLKPEKSKPSHIGLRLTSEERDYVVQQAEKSGLTVSKYIRASVLEPGYVSAMDPVKHKLLEDANRELCRQGNNLNQIAKQLNVKPTSMEEGNSMLAIITRSLLSAHTAVRRALTEGQNIS